MLFFALALAHAQSVVTVAERPDPLPVANGCERWTGTATGGNDPSVLFDVVLCGDDAVTGQVQWSSLVSGWNRRIVEGQWSADHSTLSLHDVSMADERPNPGWRFCTIDPYQLTAVSEGELSGWYAAPDCGDRADFSLSSAGSAPGPGPRNTGPPTPVFAPPTSCACAWTPAFPVGLSLWFVVMAIRQRRSV